MKNNTTTYTYLLCLLFIWTSGIAQNSSSSEKVPNANGLDCGQSLLHRKMMAKDPNYARQMKSFEDTYFKYAKNWLEESRKSQSSNIHSRMANPRVVTIPVVVHVMHLSGTPVGTNENISDAQIQAGITHLNQAFRRSASPFNIGPLYTNAGISAADIEIEFCLATIDPSGAATTGINRVSTSYSDLRSDNIVSGSCPNPVTQDDAMKALAYWSSSQYMNVWLVNSIWICSSGANICNGSTQTTCTNELQGVAGYAYFAGAHGQAYDGIVNEAAFWGSSANNSKVHIHEIGHYLNLYHTFEGGCTAGDCQATGDYVCDTPPDNSSSSVSCASSATANTCSNDATLINSPFTTNVQDIYEDYMDYGFQSCQNTFTPGQKSRMRTALFTTRKSLLTSGKCGSANTWVDAALNTIVSPTSGTTCSSTFTPQITIDNDGNTTITALTITATLSGGGSQTYNWSGTIVANSSVTITFPSTMSLSGGSAQTLQFQITSVDGMGIDTYDDNNNLSISVGPSNSYTAPTAPNSCTINSSNTGSTGYYGTGIYNFTLNTINSSSSQTIVDGYVYADKTCSDFTILSSPSTSSSIATSASVTVGTLNTERVKIYIDLDNDGNLTEETALFNQSGKGTLTSNMTIPSTVLRNTLLRMRVVSDVGNSSVPCTTPSYGQIEDYGIIISTVLGVEWVNFTAINKAKKNQLNWETSSEKSNDYFVIQRSADGEKFVDLGKIKSYGTSTTPQYYSFTDDLPLSNNNYYRLRQIDFDGTESISKTVVVAMPKSGKLKVYPSITSNILNIETSEQGNFSIFNVLGQQVLNGKISPQVDVSLLPKGYFFIKIGSEMAKFIKQ